MTVEEKKIFYYNVRDDYNTNLCSSNIIQSARFFFLNKTGFAGLYRTNLKGFFNVPFGYRKKPNFLDLNSFIYMSDLIKNVIFNHQKFSDFIVETHFKNNDFFYLDPPYLKNNNQSFVNYNSFGFTETDFNQVIDFCNALNQLGCFFSLSNSDNPKV